MAVSKKKRPKDLNQLAAQIVKEATLPKNQPGKIITNSSAALNADEPTKKTVEQ